MNVELNNSSLFGEVNAVTSKSFLHRMLIAASLSDKPTKIFGRNDCADVSATIEALVSLGAKIAKDEDGYYVTPISKVNKNAILDMCESGSTYRFMLPISCALEADATFIGARRLGERPMRDLTDVLTERGAHFSESGFPIATSGKLLGGEFRISGSTSSQYITGLLLALPLLPTDSSIIIEGDSTVSKGYLAITLDVLKKFSVDVEITDSGYLVRGGRGYISPKDIIAEGDWSNAAFPLAAGAISGKVSVRGLNAASVQGDRRILDILLAMGANVSVDGDIVTSEKSTLKPVDIYAEDIPDLVPIISVLASYARGETKIRGVERLRIKESDRLLAIIEMLNASGVNCIYEDGALVVDGKLPRGGVIDGKNDHRIVMSAAILALGAAEKTTISTLEAVLKSYPLFFDDYRKLGGKAKNL